MKFELLPVKTRVVSPPKDEIWDIIDGLKVMDGDIVFISSKIIAMHQGRTRKIGEVPKLELMREEAERFLNYTTPAGMRAHCTVTQGTLNIAAGIDESNANGYYILWPQQIDEFCAGVRKRLMQKWNLRRLGVIATDSHTMPLRLGVTGMVIGLAGVVPLKDIRGHADLFDRKIHVTQVNMVDPLAAMAVNVMGESSERTPIVILRGWQNCEFSDSASMRELKINPDYDLYRALIDVIPPVEK